ncbi:T9SS type A sorting domain-containing protein [Aggregatimonas sangjinii]|uniref:T9SS type A sorting domain-containing protein n=1 Tax=Aggregatimonas sangjinii TaxID=2583587 RepID=A0A5B7SQ38_9FLAO|nr:T9SS type A sorting domain-containing protein [Aggregatimonas sangjinii]QCX00647.1 T9SS type A sorting domain-containing protein [Aggregatimonas sangjinii]
MRIVSFICIAFIHALTYCQPGGENEIITEINPQPGHSTFAAEDMLQILGRNWSEFPDRSDKDLCHPEGTHFSKVYDGFLEKNVWQLNAHVTEDIDSCREDRHYKQRVEISAENNEDVKGRMNDVMRYEFKIKFDKDFMDSTGFGTFFQIKNVDETGCACGIPELTLNMVDGAIYFDGALMRRITPEVPKTRYRNTNTNILGKWLQVRIEVAFAKFPDAYLELSITHAESEDQEPIFGPFLYTGTSSWKDSQTYKRIKFGIYRRIRNGSGLDAEGNVLPVKEGLRDEYVQYGDMVVTKNPKPEISALEDVVPETTNAFRVFPNPAKDFIQVSGSNNDVTVYDNSGKRILRTMHSEIDVQNWPSGMYLIQNSQNELIRLVKY